CPRRGAAQRTRANPTPVRRLARRSYRAGGQGYSQCCASFDLLGYDGARAAYARTLPAPVMHGPATERAPATRGHRRSQVRAVPRSGRRRGALAQHGHHVVGNLHEAAGHVEALDVAARLDAQLAVAEQDDGGGVTAQYADLAVPCGGHDHVGVPLVHGPLGADDRDGQLARHDQTPAPMVLAFSITSSMPPTM